MSARSLMIQGTGSSVGKSLLVTALCRIFARRGLNVAPFKSQNMSLNAHTTDQGLEMSRAQAVQAEAAGLAPCPLMNPILLKPCGERHSQIIVHGKVRTSMDAGQYHRLKSSLLGEVRQAYETLAAGHDLILIEGAGSPAEINLMDDDLANMGMARLAGSPVILVADIDRGGVFASLYGTVKLLDLADQERIQGLLINKFRGDRAILEPGLRQIEYILSRPVLGVLPWLCVHIDEEDSLSDRFTRPGRPDGLDVTVIRLPRLAGFTDFAPLDLVDGVSLRFADSPRSLGRPDLLILPETRNTRADLAFLRDSGLAEAIQTLHARGTPLIGIRGGLRMLGESVADPKGLEGDPGESQGLGLLPMRTVLADAEHTGPGQARVTPEAAALPLLRGAAGLQLAGHAIHMDQHPDPSIPFARHPDGQAEGLVRRGRHGAGDILGANLHGLFDDFAFTRTLLDNARARVGLPPLAQRSFPGNAATYAEYRQSQYDALADSVEPHLNMAALERMAGS